MTTTNLNEMTTAELRDLDSRTLDAMIEANAAGQSVKTHQGLRESIRKELDRRPASRKYVFAGMTDDGMACYDEIVTRN